MIETGSAHPIRVLSLTSFTVIANLSLGGGIKSSAFLDNRNRFILIQKDTSTLIHDLWNNITGTMTGNFPTLVLLADPYSSLIYSLGDINSTAYVINITEAGTILTSFPEVVEEGPRHSSVVPFEGGGVCKDCSSILATETGSQLKRRKN